MVLEGLSVSLQTPHVSSAIIFFVVVVVVEDSFRRVGLYLVLGPGQDVCVKVEIGKKIPDSLSLLENFIT